MHSENLITMKKSLIALAFGTLGLGIAEFVMMGILPDVAKALKSYIGYASRMKKQIQEISDIAQKETDKFLSSVDDADQYIF